MHSLLKRFPGRPISSKCFSKIGGIRTTHSYSPASTKLPPTHSSSPVLRLPTFVIPPKITPTPQNTRLAHNILDALRKQSIIQIRMTPLQNKLFKECLALSRSFFSLPLETKKGFVDERSFAGYIASLEEITGGKKDSSEIFTVMKDLPLHDKRVQRNWPCHGPCPWPNEEYKVKMTEFMRLLGGSGEKLLQLTALGLRLGLKDASVFKEMTRDGWHHMRVLRFPALGDAGQEKQARGIGAHTDYGLLVFAVPEVTGGDFVRPRGEWETIEDWQRRAATMDEPEKWMFVEPVEGVMTVFPGDMLQLLTGGYLPATPHKVALNYKERLAFAYFHEPNFNTVIETLQQFRDSSDSKSTEKVHYGSHLTNMFMRNYSERITAKKISEEGRLDVLKAVREKALGKRRE